ncbi:FAD binding domain-containing protein [Stachybotrys elegans]|uniref:FAD binding domain-containing protein n=1 Tax=Stachybotrys elegans TaxID=80388 RepID=A0A8K0SRB8_9HYPO|nr:FAD binding domain-containing protein [Stachybotrys elegans]
MQLTSLLGLATLLGGFSVTATCSPYPLPSSPAANNCKCMPGDACWPSASVWSRFNQTVGNRLIASEPIGSPCHDPTYDEDACLALRNAWTNPLTHLPSSSSIMQPSFANQSCDPFTDRSIPCTLGNYVSYAVKVRNDKDVVETLKFAKANNIRLVIRNTGHDFLGRSTGAGALSIWTQDLKDISFLDWSTPDYTGPAVKVGAGVLGYELLEATSAKGLAVVSGECPTVGLAGGFTQGGGHSILSTSFGLAADNTLSFRAVTADGRVVTASPTENKDLYWALSGGGGGTYAVVLDLTVRAYPTASVGGAAFQLVGPLTTPEKFQAAVAEFYKQIPYMTDKGAMIQFTITSQVLWLMSTTVWDAPENYVRDEVLKPFMDAMAAINQTISVTYTQLSYRDHYERYLGPLPKGRYEVSRYQFGGRLIPRESLEGDNLPKFLDAANTLAANGVYAVGSVAKYAKPAGTPDNAAHPAWRDAVIQLQLITMWDNTNWESMRAGQKRMTDEFMPLIESVTPGSASYMNEADFNQPRWQQEFFGSNYQRLSDIKRKYDRDSMFYILKGVGSDAWNVAADGRMCRA